MEMMNYFFELDVIINIRISALLIKLKLEFYFQYKIIL